MGRQSHRILKVNVPMSEEKIAPFDKLSQEYDQWFDRHQAIFDSELEALRKVIPTKGVGLEVGVGTGRFAAAFGIKFGLDPSQAMLDIAKSRGIEVTKGVAESLPFEDAFFDFVLIVTTLCFVDNPLKALSEVKRVLKSGGLLIIGMIDRNSALGKNYEAKKQDNPFYRNAHFYSAEEEIQLINQLGFIQKEIYQTIFLSLDAIKTIEPVKQGYGEGGFVVIKALKQ